MQLRRENEVEDLGVPETEKVAQFLKLFRNLIAFPAPHYFAASCSHRLGIGVHTRAALLSSVTSTSGNDNGKRHRHETTLDVQADTSKQ